MERHQNPLLAKRGEAAVDLSRIRAANIIKRGKSAKRELRDQRRSESAESAMEGFDRDVLLYGFTKAQFSLIDLLRAAIERTGPVHFGIATWTAGRADVQKVMDFAVDERILTGRWLVDLTFQRRTPALAKQIRERFGPDAIRVALNHCKFALLGNDEWRVVVQTSMNLNYNPRFENFAISHDPELYAFHLEIMDEIWSTQPRGLADERPHNIHRFWRDRM